MPGYRAEVIEQVVDQLLADHPGTRYYAVLPRIGGKG